MVNNTRTRRRRGPRVRNSAGARRMNRQMPVEAGFFRLKGVQMLLAPPPYVEDTRYTRVIRLTHTFQGASAADHLITFNDLRTAVALPAFTRMHLTRIKAYGVNHYNNLTGIIQLAPIVRVRSFFAQPNVLDREFEDVGVAGAQVAHVFLSWHGTLLPFTDPSDTVVALLDPRQTASANNIARVIIDLHVTFFNTAVLMNTSDIADKVATQIGEIVII